MAETRCDRLAKELLRRYEISQRQYHAPKKLTTVQVFDMLSVQKACRAGLKSLGRMSNVAAIDRKFAKAK